MDEIEEYIEKITTPYKVVFWGDEYEITPVLVAEFSGDGRQFVGVEPINTRPNWYLVRIDSSIDVGSDDFDYDEMLLQPIENEFGNVDDYECEIRNGKCLYRHVYETEEEWQENITDWPVLSWGGGQWWVQKNFAIK